MPCFRTPQTWRRAALGIVLLFTAHQTRADVLTDEARALLDAGQAQAAYARLAPFEAERAGDTEFDLLLGMAALDAGRPADAVFALERVLARSPDHRLARAELARALFETGERDAAAREFATLERMGVPPQAAPTVQRYLDALNDRSGVSDAPLRAYVEAAGGYDSNANVATSLSFVAVPLFSGAVVPLDPNAVREASAFGAMAAGAAGRHEVADGVALVGALDAVYRWNTSIDGYDRAQALYSAGAEYRRARSTYVVALQGDNFRLEGDAYRNAYGGVAQWLYVADARTQITAFAQYSDITYPEQTYRDARRYVIGGGAARAFSGLHEPTAFASVYGGRESTDDAAASWFGYDLYGVRLGGDLSVGNATRAFAAIAFEQRRYLGDDPFFLERRRDEQLDVRVGIEWRAAKSWRVAAAVQYTRNDSNIPIDAYDRVVGGVSLRRLF